MCPSAGTNSQRLAQGLCQRFHCGLARASPWSGGEDLGGTMIPRTARSYPDLAPGKGVVVVELQGDPEKAPTSQIAKEKGKVAMEEGLEEMKKALRTMEETIRQEARRDAEQAWRAAQVAEERVEQLDSRVEKHDSQVETHIANLQSQVLALTNENVVLRTYMKRGLELGNKVKKWVALTLARAAVERLLGRTKEEEQSWSTFFGGLSNAEWDMVGVVKKMVKDLLADGAHQFNESIHNIPAEEVVGSIVTMRPGSLRAAWEDIFYLAFNMKVSDEVFRAEVDYADYEEKVLGH